MKYEVREVPWEAAGERFPAIIRRDTGTNSPPVVVVAGFDVELLQLSQVCELTSQSLNWYAGKIKKMERMQNKKGGKNFRPDCAHL